MDLYKKFYELQSLYVSVGDTAPRFSREEMLDGIACGAGLNSISVDPFGGIRPCLTFPNAFASIRKDTLKNIWEQARHWNLKNRVMRNVTPKCETCEYLEQCEICVAELMMNKRASCYETLLMARASKEMIN